MLLEYLASKVEAAHEKRNPHSFLHWQKRLLDELDRLAYSVTDVSDVSDVPDSQQTKED